MHNSQTRKSASAKAPHLRRSSSSRTDRSSSNTVGVPDCVHSPLYFLVLAAAAAVADEDAEAQVKQMQLWNLYKQSPPAITVFLCKTCRQTIYFDRQKVSLAADDHVEMRFKMCALCRKGNIEIKKLFAAYWPYIA